MSRSRELILTLALGALAVAVVLIGAERLPLDERWFGFDWRTNYWETLHDGRPDYAVPGVYNPPWTLMLLLPLAALPFKTSWALWTLINLAVLVYSVPRRADGRPHLGLIAALMLSFWTLRHIVDGNLAAMMVGGGLLLLSGWQKQSPWRVALGVVLITAKYQEAWLLLLALAWFMVREWPLRRWLAAVAITLALITPSLIWLGPEWAEKMFGSGAAFSARSTQLEGNISWLAVTLGWGLADWLRWAAWLIGLGLTGWITLAGRPTLTIEKTGFLLAASMLLAPYAGGAGLPLVLVFGLLPFWQRHFWIGLGLWLWANSAYLAPFRPRGPLDVLWPDWIQMGLIVLIWLALGIALWPRPGREAVARKAAVVEHAE